MDALATLSEIRTKECELLMLYRELCCSGQEVIAAAMLNVSLDMTKHIKKTNECISQNLKNAFTTNTSTIFTFSYSSVNAEDTLKTGNSYLVVNNDTVQNIQRIERKVLLMLRDICIRYPSIGSGCCGLEETQIRNLANNNASDVVEFCYDMQKKSSILKLKFSREKSLSELLKLGSRPCYPKFGLLMDRSCL